MRACLPPKKCCVERWSRESHVTQAYATHAQAYAGIRRHTQAHGAAARSHVTQAYATHAEAYAGINLVGVVYADGAVGAA